MDFSSVFEMVMDSPFAVMADATTADEAMSEAATTNVLDHSATAGGAG
jgi:hypothetical protein